MIFLGGVYIGQPISANESYSTGSSLKIKPEELNTDYGVLMGGSFGLIKKLGLELLYILV